MQLCWMFNQALLLVSEGIMGVTREPGRSDVALQGLELSQDPAIIRCNPVLVLNLGCQIVSKHQLQHRGLAIASVLPIGPASGASCSESMTTASTPFPRD